MNRPFRTSVSIGILFLIVLSLLAAAFPAAFFTALTTCAAEPVQCRISYDRTKPIAYDGWSTFRFDVIDAEDEHRLGYCLQPRLSSPSGTYTYERFGDGADEPLEDLFKTVLMISPGGPYNEKHGPGAFSSNDPDRQYALGHAMLGLLYSGDRTGLSDGDYSFLKERLDYFRSSMDELIPKNIRDQYSVYIVRTGSSATQNIMWLTGKTTGTASIRKQSAIPELTDGSSAYSLADALYGIYTDEACTESAGTLLTKADGSTDPVTVPAGTCYLKELRSPKGYLLNPTVYSLNVSVGGNAVLSVSDPPLYDTTGLDLTKIDTASGDFAQGAASLSGAVFRVSFYAGDYASIDELPAAPTRTWLLQTQEDIDDDGTPRSMALLDDAYKISGDDFYRAGETVCLPLGALTIEEAEPPAGYTLEDAVFFCGGSDEPITPPYFLSVSADEENRAAVFSAANRMTAANRVIRGDFSLTKILSDSQTVLPGISFSITSDTTGESHNFTTDANGHYSSAADWNPHTRNTNGGGAEDGLWFGLNENGEPVPVDDSIGALPYDTYTIKELPCEANQGLTLLTLKLSISRDGKVIDLGSVEDTKIELSTSAADAADLDRTLSPEQDAAVFDTVRYEGLTPGKDYIMKGQLIDRASGDVLTEAEAAFVPARTSGELVLHFPVDASALPGHALVVYESLWQGSRLAASHTDPDNRDQTVTVSPRIQTTAAPADDGQTLILCGKDAGVVDTVHYEGLCPGTSYTLKGSVLERDSLEPLTDAETSFVPDAEEGCEVLTFSVDTTDLPGCPLVVFEQLYLEDEVIASHCDPLDEDQTVTVAPSIRTRASGGADGEKPVDCTRAVSVIDTVSYDGLVPGKAYTLSGRLLRAADQTVLAESACAFTPDAASGSVDLLFDADTEDLCGERLVCYETLLIGETILAEHCNPDDEDQSVTVRPKIATTASDGNGNHSLPASDETVLIDTVSYEGLMPNTPYQLCGTVVRKDTGETVCKKEISFTPKEASGTTEITFSINTSSLGGKELVVFEKLSREEETLAMHADLNDRNQTVSVRAAPAFGKSAKTGDRLGRNSLFYMILALAAGTAGLLLFREERSHLKSAD